MRNKFAYQSQKQTKNSINTIKITLCVHWIMRMRKELIRSNCGLTSHSNGLTKKFRRSKMIFLIILIIMAVIMTSGLWFIPDNSRSASKKLLYQNKEIFTVINDPFWKSDNDEKKDTLNKSDNTRDQLYVIQQVFNSEVEDKRLSQKTENSQTKGNKSPKDKLNDRHEAKENNVFNSMIIITDKIQDANEGENFLKDLKEQTEDKEPQEVKPPRLAVPEPVKQSDFPKKDSKSPMVVDDMKTESDDDTKELCPPFSARKKGPIEPFLEFPSLQAVEKEHPELTEGGRFAPPECRARTRLALVVPFRDRRNHLAVFLRNLHSFLQRQDLEYTIFVVQQSPELSFNKASLMNIGFIEASKMDNFDCFIFHDLDLIPEDDRISYSCKSKPRHLSVAVNTFDYKLPYEDIFGGVVALTPSDFLRVNGFSNRYWGWGGEDDDMANRIFYHKLGILRPPPEIARYTMIPHKKEKKSPFRHRHLHEGVYYFNKDGVKTVNYELLEIKKLKLFTWIYVKLFFRR